MQYSTCCHTPDVLAAVLMIDSLSDQFLCLNRTFSADEAPADINVLVVLHAPTRGEMVGTDDAVVGEDDAARCHAQVCGVIGYRTAHAPHQTTYGQTRGQEDAVV